MRLPASLLAPSAFVLAAALAGLAAWWGAGAIEARTEAAVAAELRREGMTWATAATDGLELHLFGTAPSEAQRFRALKLTGRIVDADRIRDRMDVTPAQALQAPRFSVELLRNDDGISLIGLVPTAAGATGLAASVAAIADGITVADMLNEADFPVPETWNSAVAYGLDALKLLPRSKISIAADAVAITAIAGSEDEKRRLETGLARARPEGLAVTLDISAPRPVLTPFTLRFVKDASGARFDACSADTDRARTAIVTAAVAAGVEDKIECTIGLGVPTPRWADAAVAGIAAIAELGEGTITFSDADVTLLAGTEVPQAIFDRVVGDLESRLPDVFSLDARLPEKPDTAAPEGPPELTATLSPEGRLVVRGRLTDDAQRSAVTSFARARFGANAVIMATRLDPDLPDGWPLRVLAGLQALSELHSGDLLVQQATVQVSGVAGSTQAQARIAQTLSDRLGQGQAFAVNVRYDERLDPLAALPTPQECVADLNRVLTQNKIAFAPGSAEIEVEAGRTLDRLADVLKRCLDVEMEIGGHTDSQGSESGNLALSQARAEAVLLGLQGRRVPVGSLTAVGYGESTPIEDNATQAGREANRRIEFSLVNAPDDLALAPAEGDYPTSPAVPVRNAEPNTPDAQPRDDVTANDAVPADPSREGDETPEPAREPAPQSDVGTPLVAPVSPPAGNGGPASAAAASPVSPGGAGTGDPALSASAPATDAADASARVGAAASTLRPRTRPETP